MKGKSNVKRGWKRAVKLKKNFYKRDLREGVSYGARTIHFTLFVAIPDILQISM